VLGVLTRMLGERSTAEEILQETFLQVWQQARRFDAALGRPRSWILMMARSRALDRARSQGARERREDAVYRDDPARTAEPVGTAALESDERSRLVRAALAALPAEQRQALELAFASPQPDRRAPATPLAPPTAHTAGWQLRQSMAMYSTR
jgi:RNA polymerase sigma-70 factor (ECF subfamily)